MSAEVTELTFHFNTVVQIVALVGAGISAWFYMRGQFQNNTNRINKVETDIISHAEQSTRSIEALGEKIDRQSEKIEKLTDSVVRIETRGQILEERFAAVAGPKP